jgi:sarcosine oxidase subunit delta
MASLISCPHCGTRPKEEFTIRGAVPDNRPAWGAPIDDPQWFSAVYLRTNPRGRLREHWYHGAGCGRWLIVERDNLSHVVYDVADARTRALAGDRT